LAQIDKLSVRQEVERCRGEFQALLSQSKVAPEVEVLVKSLLTLLSLLLAIFLEKSTKKTSKNSSIPPSQTAKDESAPAESESHKKERKENDELFSNARTKKTTTVSKVSICTGCGSDISTMRVAGYEERTLIDIVFEKTVNTVRAEVKGVPSASVREPT